jgi:hypothetical protein
MLTLHDAPGKVTYRIVGMPDRDFPKEVGEVPPVPAAPSVVEHRGETADRSEAATAAADPVVPELEAALAMRLAGADPKALRRVLRRVEELLDE